MNNAVFGTNRNYLLSEPNYPTKKIFMVNILAIQMRKTEILMNKP